MRYTFLGATLAATLAATHPARAAAPSKRETTTSSSKGDEDVSFSRVIDRAHTIAEFEAGLQRIRVEFDRVFEVAHGVLEEPVDEARVRARAGGEALRIAQ